MEEIIYCVEILKTKHEILNNDKVFFLKIERFAECEACRDSEKNIETVAENLLKECQLYINNSSNSLNVELLNRYQMLLNYFDLDFEKGKERLEIRLEVQKRELRYLLVTFKFQKAYQIRKTIIKTKKDLKIVTGLIEIRDSKF